MTELDIRDLSRFSSVTRALLTTCSECASVLLWKVDSPPRTPGSWEHGKSPDSRKDKVKVVVLWNAPGPDLLSSHGNEKDATE